MNKPVYYIIAVYVLWAVMKTIMSYRRIPE